MCEFLMFDFLMNDVSLYDESLSNSCSFEKRAENDLKMTFTCFTKIWVCHVHTTYTWYTSRPLLMYVSLCGDLFSSLAAQFRQKCTEFLQNNGLNVSCTFKVKSIQIFIHFTLQWAVFRIIMIMAQFRFSVSSVSLYIMYRANFELLTIWWEVHWMTPKGLVRDQK